jgi:hypothetical protein
MHISRKDAHYNHPVTRYTQKQYRHRLFNAGQSQINNAIGAVANHFDGHVGKPSPHHHHQLLS